MNKTYKEFISKTLPQVLKCGYCNRDFCFFHAYFQCDCHNCRLMRCRYCHVFNIQMDQLMFNANQNVQAYIYNFVLDFFNVSDETLEYF